MSGTRVLVGFHTDDDDTHLIGQGSDGARFSWCTPTTTVTRLVGIGFIPDRITCPACRNGSYFHLLTQKHQTTIQSAQEG